MTRDQMNETFTMAEKILNALEPRFLISDVQNHHGQGKGGTVVKSEILFDGCQKGEFTVYFTHGLPMNILLEDKKRKMSQAIESQKTMRIERKL